MIYIINIIIIYINNIYINIIILIKIKKISQVSK